MFEIVVDGFLAMLTTTSVVGFFLLKELFIVLLLLAVVEAVAGLLRFIVQLFILAISVFCGVVVYLGAFLVAIGRNVIAEPLEQAVVWQEKSLLWMHAYFVEEF